MFLLFQGCIFRFKLFVFGVNLKGNLEVAPKKVAVANLASFLETFLAPSFFLAFSRKLGAKYKMKAGLAATKKTNPNPALQLGIEGIGFMGIKFQIMDQFCRVSNAANVTIVFITIVFTLDGLAT